MSATGLNGEAKRLIEFYKTEHRIYGRCPHCDCAFRLSDVRLTYGMEPPRDALRKLEVENARLKRQVDDLKALSEEREDEFAAVEQDYKADIANLEEKNEEEIALKVERATKDREKEIRQDAIKRSTNTRIGRVIERLAPVLLDFGHNPDDVRAMFDPLDYVVFDGMRDGAVRAVTFLELKCGTSALTPRQASIRAAVERGDVRFEEQNVDVADLLRLAGTGRKAPVIKRRVTAMGSGERRTRAWK